MFRRLVDFSLLLACFASSLMLVGQTPQPQVSSGPSGYTLHASARAVLTDVTVTDAKGNPVLGLPQSAFQIFDNNHQQKTVSFEEHAAGPTGGVGAGPVAPHTFSNEFLKHPPAAFDVIVLDTSTIGIVDQMYLNEELERFIKTLPAGQLLAIYVHPGEFTIPLQNFTSDQSLLLNALHQAIPLLQQSGVHEYSELDGLQQLVMYLSQYPGRKNVMWFNGGSNLLLRSDATAISAGPLIAPNAFRALYDQLDSARIAIYPIDVRGPIVGFGEQLLQEKQEAVATGGRAYINTNGLAEVSAKIIATGSNFYTLSYTPPSLQPDTKWHKVKGKVGGGDYHLSYRSGYYDDGMNGPPDPNEAKARTKLLANGETVHLPSNRSQPILFQVAAQPSASFTTSVMPAETATPTGSSNPLPKGHQTRYTFRYTVPAADFSISNIPAAKQVHIGAAILVFNQYGRVVKRKGQEFTLTFDGARLATNPNSVLRFDQQVDLPKGEQHVFVGVWDMETGRLGTIEVPVSVKAHL